MESARALRPFSGRGSGTPQGPARAPETEADVCRSSRMLKPISLDRGPNAESRSAGSSEERCGGHPAVLNVHALESLGVARWLAR